MRTSVKTESKFIVKPENKVVVCNISVDMQIYKSGGYRYVDPNWWATKAPKVNCYGEFTVTAIARCNSEDTFDEATGKKIAESRAKAKAFKTATNVWNCIAKGLEEKANMARTMARNCELVREVEVKHVEKLSE